MQQPYWIAWGKRNEWQVFYRADIVYRDSSWNNVINFLKQTYQQNGQQPLDVRGVNISRSQATTLENLIEHMRKGKV